MTARPEDRSAASYRELFAQPVLRRLAVSDVCARLPQGMVSITLLLVAAQHASMTVAGLVVAGNRDGVAFDGQEAIRDARSHPPGDQRRLVALEHRHDGRVALFQS
jgi:hypothetical protein